MKRRGERTATARFVTRWSLVAAGVVLAVPARASDDDSLRRDLQVAASWAATAALLGEGWSRDTLPSPYVARTLRLAGEPLDASRRTIEQDLAGLADRHGDPQSVVGFAKQRSEQLNDAIGRQDSIAVRAAVDDLERVSRRLQVVP